MTREDVQIARLKRKLDQRDKKIAGLRRRVSELESAHSLAEIRAKRLPIDVTRAVQEALCNVRMIPMIGAIAHNAKIVEVKVSDVAEAIRAKGEI